MHTTRSITAAKLFYYQLPFYDEMNFNGQKISVRKGLILQLQDSNKRLSYGEIAPLPGFSHESIEQATMQIIALLNQGISNLSTQKNLYPSVNFALSAALQPLAINEKINHLDPIPLLQGDNNTLIKQYITLDKPAIVKLKVGRQKVQQDIILFNQLSNLNPHLKIRCDANQQWSETQADCFFNAINKQQLDYIEEPTAHHFVNLRLAEKHHIALALDETLQDINFHYHPHVGIKALVLKPTLIGALNRVEQFIDIAQHQQLQVHISASFESIIGLQQLTALANDYHKKCMTSLGIDTLKYIQPGLLTEAQQIIKDLQKLECLWYSN